MNNPSQSKILPLFTLGAGGLGLTMRVWLMTSGVDEKGLILTEHPAGLLSFVFTAVTLLVLLLCVRKPKAPADLPPKLSALGCGAAAVGLFTVNLQELLRQQDTVTVLTCLAGLAAVVCLLLEAYALQKGKKTSYPVHGCLCIYLMLHPVTQYRHWSAEPQLQVYFFQLLASVMLMAACYHRTALAARQGSRRWYIFFSQAALYFCLLSLNTENRLFYLSMGIWMATAPVPAKKVKLKTVMHLPGEVQQCIRRLEEAGYSAYAVGGCVRDQLLGLEPHDYDLCTSAVPEQICQVFSDCKLVHSGEKHGTVGVVLGRQVYEITAYRTEGSYTDGRHPDWVKFVGRVEEDLARRDFTINAMAYSPAKGYIDPWGGKKDLEDRVLRAVGDPETRFTEDALRILRGVRFAVRFGLTVEPETEKAMFRLAPLMDGLARERVFDELCKLLPVLSARDMEHYAPVLTQVLPELRPMVDFDQHSPHHAYDLYTHTAHVVEAVPPALALRWAALLHDIGKVDTFTTDETGRGHFYGHAQRSAQLAASILLRLRAPTVLREQVTFLIDRHMTLLEPDKPQLRRFLGKYGETALRQLLLLQQADFGSKGSGQEKEEPQFAEVKAMLGEILQEEACLTVKNLALDGSDLLALGFAPGPELGACLQALLRQVQEETLPNEKTPLLEAARKYLQQE